MTTLKEYLTNPLGFSDEKLANEKGLPIEEEKFDIKGVIAEILFNRIFKFYSSIGYSVSEASIKGAFNIQDEGKTIGYFVFTPLKLAKEVLITVNPFKGK